MKHYNIVSYVIITCIDVKEKKKHLQNSHSGKSKPMLSYEAFALQNK